MRAIGEISEGAVLGIAEVCQSFSLELGSLVSPASAWILLARRHSFTHPETVEIVGQAVLKLLAPSSVEGEACDQLPLLIDRAAVICPEDRDDDAGSCQSLESRGADRDGRHLTEVFLPALDHDRSAHTSPDRDLEPVAGGAASADETDCSDGDIGGVEVAWP